MVKTRPIAEIELAHFSVHTYLVSEQIGDNILKHLQLTARIAIAETCLAYLLGVRQRPYYTLLPSVT